MDRSIRDRIRSLTIEQQIDIEGRNLEREGWTYRGFQLLDSKGNFGELYVRGDQKVWLNCHTIGEYVSG